MQELVEKTEKNQNENSTDRFEGIKAGLQYENLKRRSVSEIIDWDAERNNDLNDKNHLKSQDMSLDLLGAHGEGSLSPPAKLFDVKAWRDPEAVIMKSGLISSDEQKLIGKFKPSMAELMHGNINVQQETDDLLGNFFSNSVYSSSEARAENTISSSSGGEGNRDFVREKNANQNVPTQERLMGELTRNLKSLEKTLISRREGFEGSSYSNNTRNNIHLTNNHTSYPMPIVNVQQHQYSSDIIGSIWG